MPDLIVGTSSKCINALFAVPLRELGGAKTHWIALHFKVPVDRSQVKNGEPHKFDEIGWFRLDNLPPKEQLHSQLLGEIERYREKL